MMNHNEEIRDQICAAVSGLSSETLNRKTVLAQSEESLWKRKLYPHPVFGPMDVAQWVDFIGIHEERHLAQLKEALDGI